MIIILGFLMILIFPHIGFSQEKLELVVPDVAELEDAAARSASKDWLDHAETGQRVIQGLDFLLIISPDSKWILFGQPVDGLDVVTYKLFLISTANPQLISLTDQALGATFSPTSEHLFVATGPNPVIYDLAIMHGVVLTSISSGLENYPSWVSQWSEDGAELIVYQQLRFDDRSSPRAWRVKLK
jgi:hypothetical protein